MPLLTGFYDKYEEEILATLQANKFKYLATALHIKQKYGLDNNPKAMANKIIAKTKGVKAQPVKQVVEVKTTKSSEFAALKTELGLHENIYGIPQPDHDEIKIHKLARANDKILLLPDVHVKFHSVSALTTALKYGKDRGANTVYINGDFMDFYALSRFEKRKDLRDLVGEIGMGRELLQIIRNLFPDALIKYKIGNHDARWSTYIRNNAKEFEGLDDFEFESVMRMPSLGITTVPDKDIMNMGGLYVMHGHEMFGTGGQWPAKTIHQKTGKPTLMSHVHRLTEYPFTGIDGKTQYCYSTGCLSQLRPAYNALSQYMHGFAFIETFGDEHMVYNIPIKDGKILKHG